MRVRDHNRGTEKPRWKASDHRRKVRSVPGEKKEKRDKGMIFITATIALVSGYVVGTGVTLAWEWGKLRKVHRRYAERREP